MIILVILLFLIAIICIPGAIIFSIISEVVFYIKLRKSNKELKAECEKSKALRKIIFENQEKIRKEREAEKQKKIEYMKSLGLEGVAGVHQSLWIKRKNGKIKELYNLEAERIPLAELIQSPGAKTIGIEPVLYYYNNKISKQQMLKDEAEIRKLNNT